MFRCSNSEARALAGNGKGWTLVVCDGSPGVGCPVISSALRGDPGRGCGGAHAVRAVTTSSASRPCATHFRIPVAVLINKADLNHEEVQAITRLADDRGYTVVGAPAL